jgi:hypothetical protein
MTRFMMSLSDAVHDARSFFRFDTLPDSSWPCRLASLASN